MRVETKKIPTEVSSTRVVGSFFSVAITTPFAAATQAALGHDKMQDHVAQILFPNYY
jgi:hypothetical protein